MAEKRIKDIVKDFEAGEIYLGKVVRILDFGIFVELTPGRDGLVHVSELAPYRINNPADFVSVGDKVTVYVKEIDDKGRVNLTMKGMKENEPLWKDRKGESKGGDFRGNNNGRNGFNGGIKNKRNFNR
jgi:polyribonucleotide nucleotidyltransferase